MNRPLILLLCKLRVLRTLHLISANLKLYRYTDWKSVKSISDKYGISVERVIAWVRESQITTSVVGSVVLIDDGERVRIGRERKRLAHLKTNYEQLCAKFEQRIEAELRADEDAGLKMRLLDDFLPFCTDYSA